MPDLKSGFFSSLSVILISELADKTFFIAAILSGQHNKYLVFFGAFLALAIMTLLSVISGKVLHSVLPVELSELISNILFIVFGAISLKSGLEMEDHDDLEYRETSKELKEESRKRKKENEKNKTFQLLLQVFTMTLMAEWGDRSQIATIQLGATKNGLGVCLGGLVGHFICTGIACYGGNLIAKRINARSITIFGGMVFFMFGFYGFTDMYFADRFQLL